MSKNIFDYISENLNGEMKQTALDFVNCLQSNNIEFIKDNGYWKDKIYYLCKFNDEYVCFIAIKDPDEPHNQWTIWSEDSNAYEDANANNSIKNAAWKYVDYCGNCGSCDGGKTKNIFGKVFDRVCGCTFRIDNATQSDLPFLKKMIELRIAEILKRGYKLRIENMNKDFDNILKERFSTDSLISIATVDNCGTPWVRTVDAIYIDGAFYTITHNSTNKMKHITINPVVAICGEWFSGHGKAESLGYICNEQNTDLADKLRTAFASWYDNGHTNENDVNTIILKINVTDGIIYKEGKKFEC